MLLSILACTLDQLVGWMTNHWEPAGLAYFARRRQVVPRDSTHRPDRDVKLKFALW
jgi:hypothetical protein